MSDFAIEFPVEDSDDREITCVFCKLQNCELAIHAPSAGIGDQTWAGLHRRCLEHYGRWHKDKLADLLRLQEIERAARRVHKLDDCPDLECALCGALECPYGEPLHFHHDDCPACYQETKREQALVQVIRQLQDALSRLGAIASAMPVSTGTIEATDRMVKHYIDDANRVLKKLMLEGEHHD